MRTLYCSSVGILTEINRLKILPDKTISIACGGNKFYPQPRNLSTNNLV